MPNDLARWWRQLHRAWTLASCNHDLGETFLQFLSNCTAHAWRETVEAARKVKWARIYARDGYQCSSPVCGRSDVTLHHLDPRGQGGGDEPSNTSSLCSRCHLDLIHAMGTLGAKPPADSIRWTFGKVSQLDVLGRTVL